MSAMDALFYFVVDRASEVLTSVAREGVGLLLGHKQNLERFQESSKMILELLEDAEQKQVNDKHVKRWLENLKLVAHNAEDLFDEFSYENLRRNVEIRNQLSRKVCKFFPRKIPIVFDARMALKVKKFNKSLAEIINQANLLRLQPVPAVPPPLSLGRKTESYLDKSELVIGRKHDVTQVVNLLINSSVNEQDLRVVNIVGMAGLGKTALAKQVCEVVRESDLFDKIIWVCVSENFDDEMILGKMLQTVNKNTGGISGIDTLIGHLREELKEKKFILVLDDVWNNDQKRWNELKDRLSKINAKKGSAVVVTNRGVTVGMESCPRYRIELEKLSDEECWSIIERKVREARQEAEIPGDLKAIGEEIAKKCAGVPLAATVLGGIMGDLQEEKWRSIKNSTSVLDLKDNNKTLNNKETFHVLKLSYDLLSSPLKRCFAYCSIFPKNFNIQKEQLIQFWMAEGLLSPLPHEWNEVTMEDKGDEYFHDLLARSFFQDVQRDYRGNVVGCKIHSLMHDLASMVSNSETLIFEVGKANIDDATCVRHLNLISCSEEAEPAFFKSCAGKLHTLFSTVDVLNKSWKLKRLRTLKLNSVAIKRLPASIGELKGLRYLDILDTGIETLPKSITKLYQLQTLKLSNCRLPKKMKNLVSLRHLYLDRCREVPTKLGCLTYLQTLHIENCPQMKSTALSSSHLDFSRELQFLRRVCIRNCERLTSLPLDGLLSCPSLEELIIVKCPDCDLLVDLQTSKQPALSSRLQTLVFESCDKLTSAPDRLRELISLVELNISQCRSLANFPAEGMDFFRCLTRLKKLAIGGFSEELEAFPGGILSSMVQHLSGSLEELQIYGWDELKSLPHQLQHFTVLKKLEIRNFIGEGFEEALPDWLGNLSSLQFLGIYNCRKLKHLPSSMAVQRLSMLQTLVINDCPLLGQNCSEDGGTEWSKISSLPNKFINIQYT